MTGARKWDGLEESGAGRSEGAFAASFLVKAGKTGIYIECKGGSRRADPEGAWKKVKFNLSFLTWCWGKDRKGHGTTSKRLRVLAFPEVTVNGMCYMSSVSPLTTLLTLMLPNVGCISNEISTKSLLCF